MPELTEILMQMEEIAKDCAAAKLRILNELGLPSSTKIAIERSSTSATLVIELSSR